MSWKCFIYVKDMTNFTCRIDLMLIKATPMVQLNQPTAQFINLTYDQHHCTNLQIIKLSFFNFTFELRPQNANVHAWSPGETHIIWICVDLKTWIWLRILVQNIWLITEDVKHLQSSWSNALLNGRAQRCSLKSIWSHRHDRGKNLKEDLDWSRGWS